MGQKSTRKNTECLQKYTEARAKAEEKEKKQEDFQAICAGVRKKK